MGDHNGGGGGGGGSSSSSLNRNVGRTWSFSGPTSSSSDRHPPPSCSYSSAARTAAVQMPFPSAGAAERRSGGGCSLEARDCESEEGVEVAEEPAKRRGSGSKRSRAAEVHNLSEKRRRGRINEKMKALQNLIPNSNKTDKASMLDEAIEYLKQLQLQVQMLSMRNGLNLHPMYLSGALQPLQAPQMCMGFGADNGTAMNMGSSMLPLDQDSAARNSFDLSNQSTHSHQSIVIPSVSDITNPENSFGMEPSQSHQAPFQEIFTEDMVARQQLATGQTTRNLPENEIKCMAMAASQHFSGQSSSLVGADNLEECVIRRERPENIPSEDPDNPIFIQHLHGLQTGRSFSSADEQEEQQHF